MNEPKSIAAIVGDALGKYRALEAAESVSGVSWLGRWEDVGWAIRIGRKLTDAEWAEFGKHAGETWNTETMNYSPSYSLVLLQSLFPGVQCEVVWPRCNKRLKTDQNSSHGLPVFVLCDADGTSAVNVDTAGGRRVCVVRCEAHAGQL